MYPNKKLSVEEFIRRSSEIHNNYYSYEKRFTKIIEVNLL